MTRNQFLSAKTCLSTDARVSIRKTSTVFVFKNLPLDNLGRELTVDPSLKNAEYG